MKFVACWFVVLVLCSAVRADPPDLGAQTRETFAIRCVQCHGPDVPRPKGKFGYVLDLKRVAGNPKLVVPFDPAASKLWQDVENNDMPPDGAKAGPLSEPEKRLIHAWIEAGAPRPLAATTQPGATPAATSGAAQSFRVRSLRLLGKLHVPMVHFPIALLAAAAAGDVWFAWRKHRGIHPTVRFCILFGAAGALVAAGLGWIHAPYSGFGSASRGLLLHRWAGTSAAALAVFTLIAAERDGRNDRRGRVFVAMLVLTAIAVAVTGHLGGTLVYGDDYYQF